MGDISLRVLAHYDPPTDTAILRLDTKVGAQQFKIACQVMAPPSRPPGAPFSPTDPLIEPRGLELSKVVMVESGALVAALRELADAIERHQDRSPGNAPKPRFSAGPAIDFSTL